MKALCLEDRTLSVRDVDVPSPAPGEALVRVVRAGVCSTDLELVRGSFGGWGVSRWTALRGWAHAAIRPPGHQRTSPTPCWARSRVVQRQHRGMGDLGRNIDLAQEALRAEYLRQLRPHDFERIARARTRAARGLKW